MKKSSFNYDQLPVSILFLETTLAELRYEAPGIWPICQLNDQEFHDFFTRLHNLAHECLAMYGCEQVPQKSYYVITYRGILMNYPEMIRFTRELIWCCDMELIYAYRPLAPGEYDTIRLLEQTHAQLIGTYYYQHPGEEIVDADKIRFIS